MACVSLLANTHQQHVVHMDACLRLDGYVLAAGDVMPCDALACDMPCDLLAAGAYLRFDGYVCDAL